MKQCGATFFLLNLLIYTELIQQYYAEDCAGMMTNLNVTADNNRIVQADSNFSYCWKVFAPVDDYRVRLTFSTFVLNRGYDYVEIGDLWDESIRPDSLLAKFSGKVIPREVISLSRGMWIKFIPKGDLDVYHKRELKFNLIAEIRKVDDKLACPTPSSHNIIHPFENGNYSDNGYRLWWIKTTPPCTITAKPNSLWLEEQYDYVYLGDSIKGPFRTDTWFSLTGRREPWYLSEKNYTTEGTDLVVVFTSNFHRPKAGFLFKVFAYSDGQNKTHEPTEKYTTNPQTHHSTSVITTDVGEQQKHEAKFYLIVSGVSALAVAVSALLVGVIRCCMSGYKAKTNHTTYRDSWNNHFPIARSASTGSSLGRFISFFRYPDESLSDSFSCETPSSGTYSSGRFSFMSSTTSDYTSSSSSYRSSIYSRIRTLFNGHHDRDDFSVFRRSSSGKLLTTFHPQTSEDTDVESPSEETSVQSEDPRTYRRISFRTIRNAFHNSLQRNSASSFRSIRSSIEERRNRSSTYSSIQDTSYLDADENTISTVSDSVLIPPGTRMKVQHTYFKGSKVGDEPNSQERGNRSSTYSSVQDTSCLDADETSLSTDSDSVLIPPGARMKIQHTYFKGSKVGDEPNSQERGNRSSTYSSIQDTSYLDADETSLSTDSDSVFIPPDARMKVQHTYFKGSKFGDDLISPTTQNGERLVPGRADGATTRDQHENISDDARDRPGIIQPRKVLHTYFKGRNRLSSGSRRVSFVGRPLPSIPDRRRGDDDMETLINDVNYQTVQSSTDDNNLHHDSHNLQAEVATVHASDNRVENRLLSRSDDQLSVTESNMDHQHDLSRNTSNCSPGSDENEILVGATATSINSQLYSRTNKRKIVHIYFGGNTQA